MAMQTCLRQDKLVTRGRRSMAQTDPRRAALDCLCAVLDGNALESAFDAAAEGLDDRDRALARELASGTVRHFFSLREDVARFVSRPIAALDTLVLAQLVLGAYQIRHTRVPAFAAVHASVDLARATRTRSAAGMVNAVLRRVASEPPGQPRDDESRYDHPQWLVDRLASHYDQWRELLHVNQTRAPMVVRVNLARGSRATYAALLAEQGIHATNTTHSDVGLCIDPPVDTRQLPGFFDGACTIQDEGAQHSRIMEVLGYLTDVYGPRLTNSPNIREAGAYAVKTLSAWGLANVHEETWGPFGRGWSNELFEANEIAPRHFPLIAYAKAWTPGTDGSVTAEALYAKIEKELTV